MSTATDDYAAKIAPGTIRIERVLPGPIERVWSYLTESDKRGQWLASGPLEQRVGGKVQMTFHHSDLSPKKAPVPERYRDAEGSSFTSEVTRCEPPHVLAFTWPEAEGKQSEVTFELTARGRDVLLVVTHRQLGAESMTDVAGGWHTHLGILRDVLAGREPENFWVAHVRIEAEYQKRFAPGARA